MSARVGTFLQWWGEGLTYLLPRALREAGWAGPKWWTIELEADEARFAYFVGSEKNALRHYAFPISGESAERAGVLNMLWKQRGSGVQFIARVPPSQVLNKTVTLPMAAERNLRELLGFEIERQTPFKVEQVYYGYRIVSRDTNAKRVAVELLVIPRTIADHLLDSLSRWNIQPDVLTATDQPYSRDHANLLPPERRPARLPGASRLNRVLGAMVALLLGASAYLTLTQQAQVRARLNAEIDIYKGEAETVARLKRQRDDLAKKAEFMSTKIKGRLSVIQALEEVTRLLPDDTWLQQLEINGDRIDMQGVSMNASVLIGLVESSDLFKEAAFRSPITRDQRSGRERFNLSARMQKL